MYPCRLYIKGSKRLVQWLKAVHRDDWNPLSILSSVVNISPKKALGKAGGSVLHAQATAVPSIFHLTEKGWLKATAAPGERTPGRPPGT